MRVLLAAVTSLVLAVPAAAQEKVFEGPVPRADCGPGSMPETALQGEVTVADRESGRSLKGYSCNLEIVGNDPGEGGSWQHTWYDHCAYYDSRLGSGIGTYVIDASDPAKPKEVTRLTSLAMQDPWESLAVTESRPDGRKLLAGLYVNGVQGGAYMDVYDVKNCAAPEQVYSGPVGSLNHEGNWAADGMTYYASAFVPTGTLTAIDMANPAQPLAISTTHADLSGHGMSTSDDGNRLYFASILTRDGKTGMVIIDTSQVQARRPGAVMTEISRVSWDDGSTGQHTIPISVKGKPMVVFVDEGGMGMARIIDIADETKPRVISKLKLEIDMPEHTDRRDESAALSGGFGYNAHYCSVDSQTDPTVLGCSYFASGIRIFDIRDPYHPKEIAYLNVGGTGAASPPGSQEGVEKSTSSYVSARVRFVKERGEIWFTDQNKGFFTARFTNGVWPFDEGGPRQAPVGLPVPKTCLRKAAISLRVRVPRGKRARSAVIYLNGKRIRAVRGRKALRRPVRIKLPAGRHSKVRVVVTTRKGKRYTQTRGYTRCAA